MNIPQTHHQQAMARTQVLWPVEITISCEVPRKVVFKPLFHTTQKPTHKLAVTAFKHCDGVKIVAESLRVSCCDEWKSTFNVGLI
jgi:hypothetical protein